MRQWFPTWCGEGGSWRHGGVAVRINYLCWRMYVRGKESSAHGITQRLSELRAVGCVGEVAGRITNFDVFSVAFRLREGEFWRSTR
jgi:hypothetical protein